MKKALNIFNSILLTTLCILLLPACKDYYTENITNVSTTVLSNGLTVNFQKRKNVDNVFVGLVVRGGSYAETLENSGYFHLYEHMMFKSNTLYSLDNQIDIELTNLDTSRNGYTCESFMYFYINTDTENYERALAFWNAALRGAYLNEQELEDEKQVVIAEIKDNLNSSSYLFKKAFYETSLKSEGVLNSILGTEENIRNATVEDLVYISQKFIVPENCMLFCFG